MTRPATCPTCGSRVLRGYDSDTCGLPVTLDPQPVDNLGELLALTTGRRTFTVRTSRDGQRHRRVFEERGPREISSPVAHLLRCPVHAEHRCGAPLPPATTLEQPTGWETEINF